MTVRQASQQVAAAVEAATRAARTSARLAASKRVLAELHQLDHDLAEMGEEGPDVPPPTTGDEDAAAAQMVAASFSAAWMGAAMAGVLRWSDGDGGSPLGAIKAATIQTDYRLRRIAATEVSRAFNDEHAEEFDEIADAAKDRSWLPALLRRWDATLDRRVCRRCKEHDGELAVIGFGFKGGDEPGELHANCRCMSTTVFLPIPLPAKEAA